MGRSFDEHMKEMKGRRPGFAKAHGKALAKMPVSTQLAVARREAGITQEELARRLKVTQSAIAQVERPDGNPTIHTIEKIASILGYRISLAPAR